MIHILTRRHRDDIETNCEDLANTGSFLRSTMRDGHVFLTSPCDSIVRVRV